MCHNGKMFISQVQSWSKTSKNKKKGKLGGDVPNLIRNTSNTFSEYMYQSFKTNNSGNFRLCVPAFMLLSKIYFNIYTKFIPLLFTKMS